MTAHYGAGVLPERISEDVLTNQEAQDVLIPMGWVISLAALTELTADRPSFTSITSENVAKEFGITRKEQDIFAARSFEKAAAAQQAGNFKAEIVPVKVAFTDPKTQETKTIIVDADDGIRAGVTPESLAKLKPAFSKDGTTHAGNASQVSDGAAACLLVKRSVAVKLGLPILGKFITCAYAGCPPKIMGYVRCCRCIYLVSFSG